MKKITLKQITRQYANNGQHAEQIVRYTLTGKIEKADNYSHTVAADCLIYQIKSNKATVCKGLDIPGYLAQDKASEYIYVAEDFTQAWIMTKQEWQTFIELFGGVTYESSKNGGSVKIKLRPQSRKMLAYLE